MKKALYAVAVIATVTIAGWNYQQNKEVELSDLAMENVEALAQGESDEDFNESSLKKRIFAGYFAETVSR
ncbi:NVEALA domain-containing protein, partial [Phocaeicola coprocola]